MSDSYAGTFIAVNATGKTITSVSIKHECGDATNTTSVTAASLAPGEATPTQNLTTVSGSGDDWSVSFMMDGENTSRDGKGCDMPNESNQTCVLILYADDFSVVTPDDGPCMNNHY